MNKVECKYDIPFIGNDETGMHCVPAAFAMMASALKPEAPMSLEAAIQLSDGVDGEPIWPARSLIELDRLGFEVVFYESFDPVEFIARGADYFRDNLTEEVANWQIEHTDIAKEQRDYQELLDKGIQVVKCIPDFEDISRLLADGWLVRCLINSKKLKDLPGYMGHSVVILSIDEEYIELHNPGLPPEPNQRVTRERFEAAWAYPNEYVKEIIALRLKK